MKKAIKSIIERDKAANYVAKLSEGNLDSSKISDTVSEGKETVEQKNEWNLIPVPYFIVDGFANVNYTPYTKEWNILREGYLTGWADFQKTAHFTDKGQSQTTAKEIAEKDKEIVRLIVSVKFWGSKCDKLEGGLRRLEDANHVLSLLVKDDPESYKLQSLVLSGEIADLKERIAELEMQLSSIETKRQEELSNYNSYAASDIENRYQDAIEALSEWLEKDKQFSIGMMGELANPAVVVYDTCISRLKGINID